MVRIEREGRWPDIIISAWPIVGDTDEALTKKAERVFEVISQTKYEKQQRNVSKRCTRSINQDRRKTAYETFQGVIIKLETLVNSVLKTKKFRMQLSFVIQSDEFYLPIKEGEIDVEAEKAEISKELEYTKGFLNSVMKKLANERFVNNAPEQVVANEEKKQADAESKIKIRR